MPRNPPWAIDELILVLALYLQHGPLDDIDPRVVEASEILNRLPIHTVRPDVERFRNPNGVALKMANFRSLDPNAPAIGISRGNHLDQVVFNRFANNRDELYRLAGLLRAGAEHPGLLPAVPVEDEEEVGAGRLLFRAHRSRERDRWLVTRKKQFALRNRGGLDCEVCGFDFATRYGELGRGFAEVHHAVPLSQSGLTTRRLSDLVVLCSNCHRMAHRGHPWPSVEDLRGFLHPA